MSLSVRQTEGKGIITLSGDLTLQHAEEMKKVFIKSLLDADEISIAFQDVSEVDLSCLQVFYSAHRSAIRLKKRVKFAGAPPRIIKDAAKTAGYIRHKGCTDSETDCLWTALTEARND
ncbi:MAG TPA: STAS domain-containing protein [Nitrospirota bacterium]